jgi:hypothetical protein
MLAKTCQRKANRERIPTYLSKGGIQKGRESVREKHTAIPIIASLLVVWLDAADIMWETLVDGVRQRCDGRLDLEGGSGGALLLRLTAVLRKEVGNVRIVGHLTNYKHVRQRKRERKREREREINN